MKKSSLSIIGALMLVVLALGTFAGCGGETTTTTVASKPTTTTEGAVTDTTAAAPTTTLSAGDTGADWPNIVWNTFNGLGKKQLDVEAFKASAAGQKSAEYQKNLFLYKNEMDPAVLAYFEALGLKKEMHDADNADLKWASYTPSAALAPGNAEVFPVVFDFVGGERLIFSAEGHGFAHLGAKEGFITICPANPVSNGSTAITPGGQVVRILDALEAGGYPIDRSRVYVVGMSAGGVATAYSSLEFPDVIAAAAMHSSLAVMNTQEGGSPPFFTPAEDYAKAMEVGMPLMALAGDHDFSMLPITTPGVVDGLNLWLKANGCATQLDFAKNQEAVATSTDAAVKAIGLVGDKMWTETIDDVVHYGAEFYRADGVKMVEIVCVTNLPHWPSGDFPELAWEFMSRFSRGADGELIVAQ